MNLSPNFTLSEMTKSSTADRLGIDNSASKEIQDRLAALCGAILEPVRTYYKRPVTVNSGYRCLALNKAVGSKPTSQHVDGDAVDFEVSGINNYELANWCAENLDFDQLILEFHDRNIPDSGWVHCSYTGKNHRKSILTIDKNGTRAGL